MTRNVPVEEHLITVREAQPVSVLARRLVVDTPNLGATIGSVLGELYAVLGRSGVAHAGPPFAIYHDRLEGGARWDVELCAPIAGALAQPAGLICRVVPGGKVVTTVHRGPYEELEGVYAALTRWAGEHRLVFMGPPREFYLSEPDTPPAEIQTVVEWPVASATT